MAPWLAKQVLIIADDLTGALDSAAPFAARGLRTLVLCGGDTASSTGPSVREALQGGVRIVSLTTRSREIDPAEARARVEEAVSGATKDVLIFKKIDSRLKGHIEAELDALPHRRFVVLPAIPEFGRVVEGGMVKGFGVEAPVDIAARLGRHASRSIFPDTLGGSDMATALAAADLDVSVLVGARGLAEALAERMAGNVPAVPGAAVGRRVTMVIGSRDPITLAQIAELRAHRPDLHYIPAPNGIASATTGTTPSDGPTLLHAIEGQGHAGGDEVARNLAESLRRTCLEGRDGLVLSGGATAEAILHHLGIHRLEVLGEALPGLPIACAGAFSVVTKSGGFGAPDTLLRLAAGAVAGRPVETVEEIRHG